MNSLPQSTLTCLQLFSDTRRINLVTNLIQLVVATLFLLSRDQQAHIYLNLVSMALLIGQLNVKRQSFVL